MAKVEVRHLSVKINERLVLENINMKFHTQERILILGESGSGKSTLLLSLLGIIQRFDNSQVEGDVLIDGISVTNMDPVKIARIFGIVFQNPESQFCSLYPRDEVAFGLENQAMDPDGMNHVIHNAMKAFDFPENRQDHPISSLSGGQQQRLALSSVAAVDPEMILMDEPTSNLDPQGRRQVVRSAKKANKEVKGLIVVEHNLEEWVSFLDRLIVIDKDGKIFCDGDLKEMFQIHGESLRKRGVWTPQTVQIYNALRDMGHSFTKVPTSIREFGDENIPSSLTDLVLKNHFRKTSGPKETPSEPIMRFEKLSAGYTKNKTVLKDVDLTVREGDFFALVGGNGSGKSTLSKVILRLLDTSSGSISLCGKDVSAYKDSQIYDLVGYVFQNPEHQFLEDSVWSELSYSMEQYEEDEAKKNLLVDCLLEDFYLSEHSASNPFSLSGGQKRRLSVATMLVGERKILILDEPTFGQDEKNTVMLMEKLAELNRNGMTIFMITHDLDLVDSYATRTAVLHEGTILYEGSTQELWNEEDIVKKSGLDLPFRIRLMREVAN